MPAETELLNRHAMVGLAIGVIRDGRLEFHGHGFADLGSRTPVTEDTVFRVGSLTKTIIAIAISQLCERKLVELDAPAGEYLRAFRLVPATAAPTVRQLLTHTAGLPELVHPSHAFAPVLGQTVPFGHRVPTLAEFYGGGLRLVTEPGTTHTYSNHGFATLGQIIEDSTGQPLDAYFRDHIFTPLGMGHTDLVRSGRVTSRLATGYALRATGPHPVADRDLVTVGAGGVYSTTADMARYVTALLEGSPVIPEPGRMFAPQYQPDPRLPGVGLAFFRRDFGGHPVVEHEGLMPGFNSWLTVAPDDGVGIVAFTNGARGAHAWLGAEVSALLRHFLGVPEPALRTDLPQRPEVWTKLCGWYSFRGSPRDVQKWFIAGAQVFVRRGRLTLRPLTPIPALARGLALHPDDDEDPGVFRVDLSAVGLGTSRVVFGDDAFHVEFTPMSFDKRRRPIRGRIPRRSRTSRRAG
ncbi:serine hydrolase domain-containing protein [Amycolatopsis alkalitolerans]|uniref:Beta-lactamase family protein n=1 Tax=Amycolatopsis alkalitolerans TaxID=2547244 RepID=A0A5C4LRZ4_9PSEU|nr:serine hydrolase domain-containing protein [Amycolatopsis alkalitolerans]TNC18883.1 beta-lactamase family protein [Amycolatopsis alkalitolerans]